VEKRSNSLPFAPDLTNSSLFFLRQSCSLFSIPMNEQLLAKCACSYCGIHLEFPIEGAGTVINCPGCGQPTELSLEAPVAASSPDKRPPSSSWLPLLVQSRPRRCLFFYQIGLVFRDHHDDFIARAYLAMVVAAVWGVYYFATHFAFLLGAGRGGARLYLIKLMLYFGPLFIGLVLVFFMIKPLFARRAARSQPLALNPGSNLPLFAFIARICELIGAPMPKRIDLDCQLNAAAGSARRFEPARP